MTGSNPPPTLGQLLDAHPGRFVAPAGVSAADAAAIEVVDCSHDSRQIEPGWLYGAVPGANVDGHDFAAGAAARGAVALVVERELPVALPQLVVANSRAALGPLAAAVHGHPSNEVQLVGVTGTNGKSSIVQLLADIWAQVQLPAEFIGTLRGARTTPEGPDLQRQLRAAVDRGIAAVAIEVSSHALTLHRVAGCRFACAVFTNLTQDHLDFHDTMEAYYLAKASLFDPVYTDLGVVNTDDPYGRRLADEATIEVVGYGLHSVENLSFHGPTSRFRWRGHEVVLQLAGAHNVLNAVAAGRTAELLGMEPVDIADALCATSPVRGRFEMVDVGQGFHVAVDYAHTPDALTAALAAARLVVAEGRVIVVFGCGGDRDRDKRPLMARAAEDGADRLVLTSDNPRSEDPQRIIDDMVVGLRRPDDVVIEPDRRAAIAAAVGEARPGDLVLIAGKGHETYQEVGDETLDFDDREVALSALGVGA